MSRILDNMNRRFYDLQKTIKRQLSGKLKGSSDGWDWQTAIHTGDGLMPGSPLGQLAYRDLYIGSSIPDEDLGREGDMYALIDPARADKLPARANWREFATGNGVIVAVADGADFCAVSKDAKVWIQVEMPSKARWSGVAFGGGKFVAVSFDGETAHSTDGHTWVEGTPLQENKFWAHVTYGAGRFVAVAFGGKNEDGTGSGSEFTQVSTDGGLTWSLGNLPMALLWTDIAFGKGSFVALTAHMSIVATSNDGSSWNLHEMPVTAVWTSLAYGDDKFVAVAQNSSYVAYSLDGKNWTLGAMPFHANWNAVHYEGGVWLATCDRNDSIAVSLDGFTWKEKSSPVSAQWGCIGSLNGDFVYAAHDSEFIVSQPAADVKSLIQMDGSFGAGDLNNKPNYDGSTARPPAGVTGGYCLAPSDELTSLAMWFQPAHEDYDSDKPVLRWTKGSNSQAIGKLINPPRGAKSVTISKFAHWYGVTIKMDTDELATLNTDLGYNVSILRDDCVDNNYVEGVYDSNINAESGIISFNELNSSALLDGDRKYCLVVYR